MDMCCHFKQYQQFFQNALQARTNSISLVMLKHLNLLKHVKDFFRLDTRVTEAQDTLLGFDLAKLKDSAEEKASKITDEREVADV